MQALREGETTLEGLEIDTDLAWQLLISLAAGGIAHVKQIDEALAADNTAKGGEFAAQAKASFRTLGAKQAAWSSIIDNDRSAEHDRPIHRARFPASRHRRAAG